MYLDKLNKEFQILIEQTEKIKQKKYKSTLTLILESSTNLSEAKNTQEIIFNICNICCSIMNANKNIHFPQEPIYKQYNLDVRIEIFMSELFNNIKYGDYQKIIFDCFCNIYGLGYSPLDCLKETIKELISKSNDYQYGVYNEPEYLKELENDIRFDNVTSNIELQYKDNHLDIIIDYGREVKTYALWYKANFDKYKL